MRPRNAGALVLKTSACSRREWRPRLKAAHRSRPCDDQILDPFGVLAHRGPVFLVWSARRQIWTLHLASSNFRFADLPSSNAQSVVRTQRPKEFFLPDPAAGVRP